jgi:hypothetical protein
LPSTRTRPPSGDVEALHELGDRALARTRGSDDADNLSGADVERDIVQDFGAIDAVPEGHVIQRDIPLDRGQRGARGIVGRLGGGVEDVAEPCNRHAHLVEVLPHLRQAQHRLVHPHGEDIERDELAHGEAAVDHEMRAEEQDRRVGKAADELHGLARRICQGGESECGGRVSGELLFPPALHLRFDRHGLEGLDA